MSSKSVVLLSGGMDSLLAAILAKQSSQVVEAMWFNYGQSTWKQERLCSQRCANQLGIPWAEYLLPVKNIVSSALLPGTDAGVDEYHPNNSSLLKYFVPGRNAAMLTLAGMRAYTLGAEEVYSGICSTSVHAYPDCTQTFIQSIANTLRLALDYPSLDLLNPCMDLERWQVFQRAYDLDRENEDNYTYYLVYDEPGNYSPPDLQKTPLLSMMRWSTISGYNPDNSYQYSWGFGPRKGTTLDPAQEKREAAWWKFLQESGYEDEVVEK